MKPSKKIDKKLARRVREYEIMIASNNHESKVDARMRSGGYTRPGSRKKG